MTPILDPLDPAVLRQPVTPDMVPALAQAAHEAVRAYCVLTGDAPVTAWANLPDNLRQSAIAGVRGVMAGNDPAQQHESWMATRLGAGWRLGPVKDELARTHPNLVPYAELPPAQRVKDLLFADAVQAQLRALVWVKVQGRL